MRCSCGRQAIIVFETEKFGPVGWCGRDSADDDAAGGVQEGSDAACGVSYEVFEEPMPEQ